MGAQILNDRSARRIASNTGLDIARAWGRGGYVHAFVTTGHQHGWYNIKTKEWGFDEPGTLGIIHYTSCHELFADSEVKPCPGCGAKWGLFPSDTCPQCKTFIEREQT